MPRTATQNPYKTLDILIGSIGAQAVTAYATHRPGNGLSISADRPPSKRKKRSDAGQPRGPRKAASAPKPPRAKHIALEPPKPKKRLKRAKPVADPLTDIRTQEAE